MAGRAESIDAYSGPGDVLTPYLAVPSSSEGEFSGPGTNPVAADLNALSFAETSRSPYDGDASRSQGKFPTKNSGKKG